MNGQLTLDDARTTDPETSHQAAAAHREQRVTDRERALDALVAAGGRGLTDFELSDAIGRVATSAGKRRHELVAAGMVRYAGFRRPSPSGSQAMVWETIPDCETLCQDRCVGVCGT